VKEDEQPRQIGDYEIVAKLADGGVGTVYLARRRGPAGFQRLVAIKRLHPQFAAAPSFVTMFTDEARLAARIHHANVVSIVELGTDDEGYYVVMEYVEGSNLGHLHWHATKAGGDQPMSRAVALRIVLDALSGLQAAHEVEDDDGTVVNLVHRDVSPQNILIGVDGLARLGDFGIARASALRVFETRGAALKGKLEYMAPEQIEHKDVDRTTDLFAMGIVLWELLTGRRLFQAANQVTTIQRVCFDPIPSPRSIEPAVSPELERICAKALERARPRRYPTAIAFAEELEKAARADVGIATQREVAAFMKEVLGSEMPTARHVMRVGNPANASTHQLPASDPMIQLAAHPPVSGDPLDTEPGLPPAVAAPPNRARMTRKLP
jgi:serine/threonine protein kinase